LLTLAAFAGAGAAAFAFWPSDPPPLPEVYWQLLYAGIGSLERGEYDDAEYKLEHAIKLAPNEPEPRKYLGATLVARGDTLRGVDLLLKHLEKYPDDAEALLWTARAYLKEESAEVALIYYEQACDRDPRAVEPRKEIARLHLRRGDLLEAMARIQEALRVAPDDKELNNMMQQALLARATGPETQPGVALERAPVVPDPLQSIRRSRVKEP
jgi:Flp pilus assembly protein TadD